MPIRVVPDTDVRYHLISFDGDGRERSDDPDGPGGKLSETIKATLASDPVTDVFLMSHGWKGDVPAAIDQYDRWIGAMLACDDDRSAARAKDPAFHALLIGAHWPSLPWGEENQPGSGGISFGADDDAPDLAALKEEAATSIADTPAARAAIDTIFESVAADFVPDELSPEVVEAFNTLASEAGLGGDGPGAAPGDDGEAFDPRGAYAALKAEDADVDFGIFDGIKNGVLGLFRQLSFWKMKKRARSVGESGVSDLLRSLQAAVPAGRSVRFHLMGHSFGCIVISATLKGDAGTAALAPVNAVYLVQGALSYWSYCNDIPSIDRPGYFHPVIDRDLVSGPLLVTTSVHDTAVGKLYPLAAGLAGQVDFASDGGPKYGALGTFGARGPGIDIEDLTMGGTDATYAFESGKIYNLDADGVINEGGGASGAHNDIDKPAVAHALWTAVLETMGGAA